MVEVVTRCLQQPPLRHTIARVSDRTLTAKATALSQQRLHTPSLAAAEHRARHRRCPHTGRNRTSRLGHNQGAISRAALRWKPAAVPLPPYPHPSPSPDKASLRHDHRSAAPTAHTKPAAVEAPSHQGTSRGHWPQRGTDTPRRNGPADACEDLASLAAFLAVLALAVALTLGVCRRLLPRRVHYDTRAPPRLPHRRPPPSATATVGALRHTAPHNDPQTGAPCSKQGGPKPPSPWPVLSLGPPRPSVAAWQPLR